MIDGCLSDPFQIQHRGQRHTEAAEHWKGMKKRLLLCLTPYFMFHKEKKVVQVWTHINLSKWQYFHLWLNYSFSSSTNTLVVSSLKVLAAWTFICQMVNCWSVQWFTVGAFFPSHLKNKISQFAWILFVLCIYTVIFNVHIN